MTSISNFIKDSTTVPVAPISGSSLYSSGGRLKQMSSSGNSTHLDVSAASFVVGAIESDYTTIQAAVNAAVAAGASIANQFNIWIRPGNYSENVVIYEGINLSGGNDGGSARSANNPIQMSLSTTITGSITADFSAVTDDLPYSSCSVNNILLIGTNALFTLKFIPPTAGFAVICILYLNGSEIQELTAPVRPVILFAGDGSTNASLLCSNCLLNFTGVNNKLFYGAATLIDIENSHIDLASGTSFGGAYSITIFASYSTIYGYFDGSSNEVLTLISELCYIAPAFHPLINNLNSSGGRIILINCIIICRIVNLLQGSGGLSQFFVTSCTSSTVIGASNFGYSGITVTDYKVLNSGITFSPASSGSLSVPIPMTKNSFNSLSRYSYLFKAQTTNTTNLSLPILTIAISNAATIEVTIKGNTSTYSDFTGGTIVATVLRAAGNISLVDVQYVKQISTTGDFSISVDTGTQSVILNATGVAASTYNWDISINYLIS